ncbi:MAG: carbon-nitrogen hydrolase family protein, partial [Planctomycetota bacterium]
MRSTCWKIAAAACWVILCTASLETSALRAEDRPLPHGWTEESPREEIRPDLTFLPSGGPHGAGSFVIEADQREGLFGWWEKTFEIEGGKFYQFSAVRKADGIEVPRRTAVARVLWRDDQGRPVLHDEPSWASYRPGERPRAEP